ncbi:MAG: abortive infection bacteriophage resistance protein [Candidatus Endobugula sp.]|jgi:abortive infection bacteriophage resistance protein
MGTTATNTSQQIELLEERGMIFDVNLSKVKEVLHDKGYYRLGFYWNPFQVDDEHNFREGTKFSDILSLYYIDVDLRNLLNQYLYRIEVNFRTNIIYYVSNANKNIPTWFADSQIVNQAYINEFDQKVYTQRFIDNNKTIKHHHRKYINDKYAPAWKTLEFFTFGAILRLFKALKDDEIKKRIAGKYDVRNLQKFEGLIDTVVYIRNASAHGNVIYDLRLPKGAPSMPHFAYYNNQRHSLDCGLRIIQFLLSHISINRSKDFEERVKHIFVQYESNPIVKEVIARQVGFELI